MSKKATNTKHKTGTEFHIQTLEVKVAIFNFRMKELYFVNRIEDYLQDMRLATKKKKALNDSEKRVSFREMNLPY